MVMRQHVLGPLLKGTLLAATLLQAACGCVFGKADEAPAATPVPAAANAQAAPGAATRVAVKWQDKLLATLQETAGATEAWGLFTAGGWSNSGQVMIVLSADRKTRRLMVVPPNKAEIAVDRALTDAELKSVEQAVAGSLKLQDIAVEAFDAPEFELVRMTRGAAAGAKAEVARRLFVRDAGNGLSAEHQAVIDAFLKLRG